MSETNEEKKEYSVLIVDDNIMNVKVIDVRLKKKGVKTTCISDPKQAMDLIYNNKFDLILLDVIMPEVSGLDLLIEIRKTNTHTTLPVIMTTAKADSSDLMEAMKIGANDYLTKPIDFTIAWARIETHIRMKRYHEDLEQQRQKTIESARMGTLISMAGSVAHEINNPLTIILGRVQLLMSAVTKDGKKEKILKGLDNIFKSVLRVESVVKGLRAFAQEDTVEEAKNIAVKDVLQTTLNICQSTIQDAGIELRTDNIDEAAMFFGREGTIIQVFFNLLKNSQTAISNLENKWIEVSSKIEGDKVKIYVTDSGEGIRKDIQEKIMLPFFTEKEIGTTSMGLGLSISKGIIEEHGGTLELNGDFANTQFVISMPKAREEEKDEAA